MAAESRSSPDRIFEEDAMRHLLAREVQRSTRYQDFLCLCLIRPRYTGSAIEPLQSAVAREIAEMLRVTDVVGLIGDDIAVLLIHTPASDGVLIGARIRERIEAAFASSIGSAINFRMAMSNFPTDATADTALLDHAQSQLSGRPAGPA